jgi:hypothetical protein
MVFSADRALRPVDIADIERRALELIHMHARKLAPA